MAAIKSCTGIEQSRKLAEFLPHESADIRIGNYVGKSGKVDGTNVHYYTKDESFGAPEIIPAWSFAALLNVMPQINEWTTPYGHKNDKLLQFDPKICKIWEHSIVPSYKVTYGNGLSTDIYDNPVDACVAMIEKLHKRKLL